MFYPQAKNKKSLNKYFSFIGLSLILFFTQIIPSYGVNRIVYFTQTGRNVTTEGLGESVSAVCRVTVSNPSSQSQRYTLSVRAEAVATAAPIVAGGAATYGGVSGSAGGGCTPASGGVYSCGEHTLGLNGSHTYTFVYPPYPTRPGTTLAHQIVNCSGQISADDVTNPGFLLGTGSLLVFSESGAIQTQNSTGGTTNFGGQALFTQVPLSINRGKPF